MSRVFTQSVLPLEEVLAHSGVKGMHWGQRKASNPGGVSNKTNREAKKLAEEHTRAKLFFGEGAGTRRKLVKAQVEAKSKDPAFKAAFDHHVAKTDLGKRASQAQSERKRKDVVKSTKKTTRGVKNVLTGNSQFANTTAVVLVSAGTYAHKTGVDKTVANAVKKNYKQVVNSDNVRRGLNFIKNSGFNT